MLSGAPPLRSPSEPHCDPRVSVIGPIFVASRVEWTDLLRKNARPIGSPRTATELILSWIQLESYRRFEGRGVLAIPVGSAFASEIIARRGALSLGESMSPDFSAPVEGPLKRKHSKRKVS